MSNDETKPPIVREPIVTNVSKCARCGGIHLHLAFKPFTIPPANSSHFALCPENGEPIICLVESHGEIPSKVTPIDPQPIGPKFPNIFKRKPGTPERRIILPGE